MSQSNFVKRMREISKKFTFNVLPQGPKRKGRGKFSKLAKCQPRRYVLARGKTKF